ncbi:MAG: hypothetical protein AAF378_22285 [Cyanobacteria bacterium P01_A01_bin.84]
MDAFALTPPEWTDKATHALQFHCPQCQASSLEAEKVWINRRSPVIGLANLPNSRRKLKWQEFYQCECGYAWWAWSSDRPPTELSSSPESSEEE